MGGGVERTSLLLSTQQREPFEAERSRKKEKKNSTLSSSSLTFTSAARSTDLSAEKGKTSWALFLRREGAKTLAPTDWGLRAEAGEARWQAYAMQRMTTSDAVDVVVAVDVKPPNRERLRQNAGLRAASVRPVPFFLPR